MNEQLLTLLDQANELAFQFSGGYSNEFLSAEEFHQALLESIGKLKLGDETQLEKLYFWFLPTGCWDVFVGTDGADLANNICSQISNVVYKS